QTPDAQAPAQSQQPAETQAPSQQPQAQAPAQTPDQPSTTTPDGQASPSKTDAQIFTGTVTKQGDRYMLQDASGKSYDIDRQDLAKSHEGQKVRVQGTLDADGKTIHVK